MSGRVELLETGPTEADGNDGVVVAVDEEGKMDEDEVGGVGIKALLLSCFNPKES